MDYLQMDHALTVTQVNAFIAQLLEGNDLLSGLHIRGEISNFKRHPSGHLYFSLKDAGGVLRSVMFRSAATRLRFQPEDGMKVTVRGRIGVYQQGGQYQLYADSMEPDGLGALYVAFEQLKRRLADEGLFDDARKRPIPRYPAHVGIITSPSGAAVQDLINILSRRYPLAHVTLYPALVQGEGAPDTLISGIRYFSDKRPDVIIIGRGGGSIEDLWCFNDEGLAREIAACPVPVISAVGHETDFTICDFVADLRAPTPSAAAELAVPDMGAVLEYLSATGTHVRQMIESRILLARHRVEKIKDNAIFRDPTRILTPYMQRLDDSHETAVRAMQGIVDSGYNRLSVLAEKLQALSPLAVLARGYAIASGADGRRLNSVKHVKRDDEINVRLRDGCLHVHVNEIEKENQINE